MTPREWNKILKEMAAQAKENTELKERLKEMQKVEEKAIEDWLKSLSLEHGFRDYYTVRKRALQAQLSNGLEGKQYWTLYGQLQELKTMAARSSEILEKEKKEKKGTSKV